MSLVSKAQFLNTGGDIDQNRVNFGFLLGIDRSGFIITKQSNFRLPDSNPYTSDTLYAVKPIGSTGFSLGLLTNLKLTNTLDFRFTPRFSFISRQMEFQYNKKSADLNRVVGKEVESTLLELPLLLKLKSARQQDVRLYVIGGIKFCTDIRSKKKKGDDALFEPGDDRKLVKIDNNFFAVEAGLGADIYFEYFKFSPELKLSRSMANVLKQDNNVFSQPLTGLFAEALHFTMYFE
ncbi:probable protein-translocating porin PorT [Solitalea koreensis]|uniref:Probable protein-translocating porin PorT n=2 Tax=Solitalea koreensis TaxID=543615 RepID=A0A521D0B0_9SPHI|nr:probable protein-translocating porin PorT [Solitalea koreensis]